MGTTWNNEKKKMPKSYYWENNNNKVHMNLLANIIIPRRIVYIKPICNTQALYTLIACIYYKLDILQLFFKIDYPLNMKFKGWNFQAISLCLPFLTNKISYWTTCNCTNHSTKSQYLSKQRGLLIGTHGKERKEKQNWSFLQELDHRESTHQLSYIYQFYIEKLCSSCS